ncbi:MAG: hypothetical protein MUE54_09130 [Anaerolineae bacterium]|nr:hypothetical protein [Anaerolineae bacterium]
MKPHTPFIIMSLFVGMFILIFAMFTNQPSIAQNPTPTPDDLQRRATEIVAQATQTAQSGGDFTSVGTSTPLAGLCNSLTYRPLDDVATQIQANIGRIVNISPDLTVDVLLLEETADCVVFEERSATVTITIPIATMDELHDETRLGDVLGSVLLVLYAQSPLDTLANPTITLNFAYGNQTRTFSAGWDAIRGIGGAGIRGAEAITQITSASIEGN